MCSKVEHQHEHLMVGCNCLVCKQTSKIPQQTIGCILLSWQLPLGSSVLHACLPASTEAGTIAFLLPCSFNTEREA